MKKKLIFAVAVVFAVNVCLILWFQASALSIYKEGSRGDTVKQIQKVLASEGLYSGKIDGIYGKNTKNAVIAYQKRYGLNADGIVGEKTLARMGLAQISQNADVECSSAFSLAITYVNVNHIIHDTLLNLQPRRYSTYHLL